MKPLRPLFLCCFFLVLLRAALLPVQAAGSKAARALFRNPPREYSTGPLWVWNDLLTEEEIRGTLRDLARQQVKQVWVHPRPGLMTPYLSNDWFRLWKVALREARRLDMNVWIYDENSYPSGFAGGLVPEAMPQSRGRGVAFHESETPPTCSSNLLGVYLLNSEGFQNVTARLSSGEVMPSGRYLAANEVRAGDSPWTANRCYVNLLSPGVTEEFLKLTFEPYRREIGREFGRRVPGVFTDEPNIRPAAGLPWSEILPAEFQKRWGYGLLDHLPSLQRPVGDWRKIRHNYYQVLSEQFIEHWSRPYHDYCASNHLEWTGHYWDHEWPDCGGVPDNMAMYAWHQRPAIDCLMNQYAEHTHAQFGNARMVRELASVANQLGMKRTLCEAYGAGGWDLRFVDMKRIGDWLEVLGVNTLNQHLSYVTLRGARKRDHPQSFSYHEPWWEAYHVSAEYFARLSAALSQGEQINHVLLLEPTTTAWMYQGDRARLKELGDSFFQMVMTLEAAQVEYDIGCEDILARHGAAGAGGLTVGRRDYRVVVIPPFTENLNSQTVQLLRGLVQSGGSVLCCGDPPNRVDGVLSSELSEIARSAGWRKVQPSQVPGACASSGFSVTRDPADAGILFHQRRQLGDGQLLFLVNTSLTSPSAGAINSDRHGMERWDLETGRIEPFQCEPKTEGVTARYQLPPAGSLLLFLSDRPGLPVAPFEQTLTIIRPESGIEVRRLESNVLTLDYVDVSAGGESRTNAYFYPANQFVWQRNGLPRDPWDSAVQFKDELISRKFPPGSGFKASYRFVIVGEVPPDLAIVIERPDLYELSCNGRPMRAKPGEWWLDKAFGRIPIAPLAVSGENIVTLKASPFTIFHELEPAYLLGDFSLRSTARGFEIEAAQPLRAGPEGWAAQGCPFYSAGVAYRQTFQVPRPRGRFSVKLPEWNGSVARVSINEHEGGWIVAPPWECDVTRWIKPGRNDVTVTVIGTLKNTLGPHHGQPALGAAWPSEFQKGPASGPPPGTEYSTVAYGLFSPFALEQRQR